MNLWVKQWAVRSLGFRKPHFAIVPKRQSKNINTNEKQAKITAQKCEALKQGLWD